MEISISRKKLQLLAIAISFFILARVSLRFLPRYIPCLVIITLLFHQLFMILPSRLRAATTNPPVPHTQPTTPHPPHPPPIQKHHPLKLDIQLPPPPTLNITEIEHNKTRFPTLLMTFGKVKRFCLNREAALDIKRRVVDLPVQAEPYRREDGGIAIVLEKNDDDDEYREDDMRVGFRAICRLIRRLDIATFVNVRLTMPDVVPFSNIRLKDVQGKGRLKDTQGEGTRLRRLEYSGDFASFPILCHPLPSFPFHLLETIRITDCRISVDDCVAILSRGVALKTVKLETITDCHSVLAALPASVSFLKIEKLWLASEVDLAFFFDNLDMQQLQELVFAHLPRNTNVAEYRLNWKEPPAFKIEAAMLQMFNTLDIGNEIQVDVVEAGYDI